MKYLNLLLITLAVVVACKKDTRARRCVDWGKRTTKTCVEWIYVDYGDDFPVPTTCATWRQETHPVCHKWYYLPDAAMKAEADDKTSGN